MEIDHKANKTKCKESIANIKKFIHDYMIDEGPKEELLSAIHDYAECQINHALAVYADEDDDQIRYESGNSFDSIKLEKAL